MAASSPDEPVLPGVAPPPPVADSPSPASPKGGRGRRDRAAETEETDVWWGSYAGRTMLPGFLVCLFVTVALFALDWYLGARHKRSDLVSFALLGCAGALWLFQGTRWVYRMIAVNYRLTTRRLLCTRGFRRADSRPVELARVTEVSVVRGPLERLLGVGRVSVRVQDGASRVLVLDGVPAPERVARTIRRRVRQAKARA